MIIDLLHFLQSKAATVVGTIIIVTLVWAFLICKTLQDLKH